MEEFWIYCETCNEECPHEVLKSRTSSKRGFNFQGVVKCIECNTTVSAEITHQGHNFNEHLKCNILPKIVFKLASDSNGLKLFSGRGCVHTPAY